MKTTLDLALTRYGVVCHSWHEVGGTHPQLGAFLAGWFLRDLSSKDTVPPDTTEFHDSFRRGWREADDQIFIIEQHGDTSVGRKEGELLCEMRRNTKLLKRYAGQPGLKALQDDLLRATQALLTDKGMDRAIETLRGNQ